MRHFLVGLLVLALFHSLMKEQQNLKILQWNCRSLGTNQSYLVDFLHSNNCDVLLIQSTKLAKHKLPTLEGFFYPPIVDLDSTENLCLVATYISKSTNYTAIKSPVTAGPSRLSSCAIQIYQRNNKPVNIVNIYYPEGCNEKEDTLWLTELADNSANWFIGGDFNSRHPLWDNNLLPGQPRFINNPLAENLSASCVFALNDGTATRLPDIQGHKPSAIDLSLVSGDLWPDCEWTSGPDDLRSDHLVLITTVGQTFPDNPEIDQTAKYNFKKADWVTFSTQIHTNLNRETLVDPDIETHYQNLRSAILNAADSSIPKIKPASKPLHPQNPWWTEECKDAVAKKRKANILCQKHVTVENLAERKAAERHCEKVIAKAKLTYWDSFVANEVRNPSDAQKVWQHIKKIKSNYRPVEKPLLVNGQKTSNNREKANALADNFAKVSQSAHLPPDCLAFRQQQEVLMNQPLDDNNHYTNKPFKLKELTKAITQIKKTNKAAGTDPLSYQIIKKLPSDGLDAVLEFFNTCWTKDTIPGAWKEASIIAIPKPGKAADQAASYRPIALTPHLGKLYERLVKNRLNHFLDANNVIPLYQAGFRKGRACADHFTKITAHAKRSLSSKNTMLATFFDIKRAFDCVWHKKLLDKLSKLGLSGHIYRFVEAFLSDRTIAVKVGNSTSAKHTVDMGVPQGSVIAPCLFSIMLHDITSVDIKDASIALYADDLAVWDANRSRNRNHNQGTLFQEIIDNIVNYMKNNGFDLSAEKTVLLVISRIRQAKSSYSITVNNVVIQPSAQVKFLGVTITDNLSWAPHISNLCIKARKSLNLLKVLRHKVWARNRKTLLTLVQSLIRSKLQYGQEAFFAAPAYLLKKLQQVETQALKLVFDTPKYALNTLIYQEAGWLPLDKERNLRCATYQVRANSVPNSTKVELTKDFDNNDKLVRRSLKTKTPTIHAKTTPLYEYTKTLFRDSGADIEGDLSDAVPEILPSWLINFPTSDLSLGDRFSKKDDPHILAAYTREFISEKYHGYLKVFTDGSKGKNGSAGCGFVIPELQIEHSYKLNDHVSVYTSELFAIYMASQKILSLQPIPQKIAIFSDSLSSLQALENLKGHREELLHDIINTLDLIIDQGSTLCLAWVPSHIGIRGNDMADTAAKTGASLAECSANLGLSSSEMCSLLKQTAVKKHSQDVANATTEHGWFFCDSKSRLPPLPYHMQSILFRIRTVGTLSKFFPTQCTCGKTIDFHHIFEDCAEMKTHFGLLHNSKNEFNLTIDAFIKFHPEHGWYLARQLCAAIMKSPYGTLF